MSFLRNWSPFWIRDERRLRVLWRLALQLVLFVFLTLILDLAPWLSAPGPTLGGLAEALAVLGSVWLAAIAVDRRCFGDYGLGLDKRWWSDFTFGLLAGAVPLAVVFLVEWPLGWVLIVASPDARPQVPLALLSSLCLFTFVGFSEELLSRGYHLRNLAEALNFRPLGPRPALVLAWLLSSLAFGLMHAGNPHATALSTVAVGAAGLSLGLGYVLTGRLALPIGSHISWNFFEGAVFGFPVSGQTLGDSAITIEQRGPTAWTGGAFGPEAGLLGIAAVALEAALILAWVRSRYGTVAIHTSLSEFRHRAPLQTSALEPVAAVNFALDPNPEAGVASPTRAGGTDIALPPKD